MVGGGFFGKGLVDFELLFRIDMRVLKRFRIFFCWFTMCVSDSIFLLLGWFRKRFREIEYVDDSVDINRLCVCVGDCFSVDDSGVGD